MCGDTKENEAQTAMQIHCMTLLKIFGDEMIPPFNMEVDTFYLTLDPINYESVVQIKLPI